jgi:hypothetical protein
MVEVDAKMAGKTEMFSLYGKVGGNLVNQNKGRKRRIGLVLMNGS